MDRRLFTTTKGQATKEREWVYSPQPTDHSGRSAKNSHPSRSTRDRPCCTDGGERLPYAPAMLHTCLAVLRLHAITFPLEYRLALTRYKLLQSSVRLCRVITGTLAPRQIITYILQAGPVTSLSQIPMHSRAALRSGGDRKMPRLRRLLQESVSNQPGGAGAVQE